MVKKTLLVVGLLSFTSHAYDDAGDAFSIYDLSLAELSQITVVTAASGFEQKSSDAPANVTVIDESEWQAMGARTLQEVLNKVPGVHVSKTFSYEHMHINMRGLSGDASAKTKILIDGEPIRTLQDKGIFNGFHLPLGNFKRIEVIKGPGSAIYGADAFAGIINLVSHDYEQLETLIGGRAGSFNSYDVYGQFKQQIGNAKVQLSFDYMTTDDDKNKVVSSDLQTIFDGIFGSNASNAPGVIDEHYEVFSAMAKVEWDNLKVQYYTWRNFDLGLGSGIAQALDTDGESAVHYNNYTFDYDLSEHVKGTLNAVFSYKDQSVKSTLYVFPAGTVLPIGSDGNANFTAPTTITLFTDGYIGTPSAQGRIASYRLTHLVNLTEEHLFRWEIGYEKQKYRPSERKNFGPSILDGTETVVGGEIFSVNDTPYIFMPNVDRSFYYLSLQDEWHIDDTVQLTLGARYDHYSDFGSTINPRLGLIWQYDEQLKFKLFAGSAFQSPGLSQLYAQNNPVGLGNPKLQPESIDTFESGFNAEYFVDENMMFTLSLYKFKAKDLVEFVFDPTMNGAVAQNIGRQEGRGGEFVFKWKPIENLTINANYSLMSLEDSEGVDIANVPTNMGYIALNWKVNDNWNWHIDAKKIGKRTRIFSDTRDSLEGYTWVTTRLERSNILPNLHASFIVNNLFDSDAREPSNGSIPDDYPLESRQVLFELQYEF